MKKKKRIKQMLFIAGGILAVLVLCRFLLPLRSDSFEVKYAYEGERITQITVSGSIPYGLIDSSSEESFLQDGGGNVTEIIQTVEIEAKFSLRLQTSMKIYPEVSDGVTHTYILKFPDKNVTITDGKVVEQEHDN